ncbi:MAG: hypothetical protein CML73_02970 [Rhodobiaceae bacterium]|nr:hypothetical protein [Rhodobiaceae bacterium]
MSTRVCRSCDYWKEIPSGIVFIEGDSVRPAGECRINPPAPALELATHAYGEWGLVNWPITGEIEWCGKFSAKPVEKPAVHVQPDQAVTAATPKRTTRRSSKSKPS